MIRAQIEHRARFDGIRYAQTWEDADVLTRAMGPQRGSALVSICSAGDNVLALLTLDPARVVAIDLSAAQIACLNIRIAAYRTLDHGGLLELLGSRPSLRRAELFDRVAQQVSEAEQVFWADKRTQVVIHGLAGIGRLEHYFRLFRSWLLPMVHGKNLIDDVFKPKPPAARAVFLNDTWCNWRWRILLNLFFSKFVMGRLGRDPAFFRHVETSLTRHVAGRIEYAAIELDPSDNPYLHWILKGEHGTALPLAWRKAHFETIRERLDRVQARRGSLEAYLATGEKADGYNLSDIFEYMDEAAFEIVYGNLLAAANRNARLIYWNMMVPRRVPKIHARKVRHLDEAETSARGRDKAFFYSDFVAEQVL